MSGATLALALARAALAVGLLAAACHQPSQPPLPPSQPTNPTNEHVGLTLAGGEIDGSIVPDAGPVPPGDAGVGLFDAAPVSPH
jgi:hypothetical protein